MKRFKSILIANRGEIACRVMRTAKALGYRTIAVYSDTDADAPHVRMADDAVRIGPSPAGESYLVADLVLRAAATSGAEAVHPGYGFLSENAAFAGACEAAGLVFIGPPRTAIDVMGNKAEAKRRMIAAGVPCVPGYEGHAQTDEALLAEGMKIDLPMMVKAAAGGGGRGMRLVHAYVDLANAITLARAEAESAFGSGELILEKAIIAPRHVEIQVFADAHGQTIHLGERDCSVQRRHQKVIEEAPCPIMTPALREAMGQSAIAAAKSVAYCGAGTIEFLLDSSGVFYFLEMNTRLQVEHPVTEIVTGLDLVALQIRVAQGEPLGLEQDDVHLSGHAIEARLYTEDPSQDFLPAAGPVELWLPAAGPGIRIDAGIASGQAISPFYDPMVAKVIGYGETREIARLQLLKALQNTQLFGTANNQEFLIACLQKQCFIDGQATTAFIASEFSDADLRKYSPTFGDAAVAAVIETELAWHMHSSASVRVSDELKNWSGAGALVTRRQYAFDDQFYDLMIVSMSGHRYTVKNDNQSTEIEVLAVNAPMAELVVDGSKQQVYFVVAKSGQIYLGKDGRSAQYQDRISLDATTDNSVGAGRVIAPMHGLLLEVAVSAGDVIVKGQLVAVLEAMKMHYEIVAEVDGLVAAVLVTVGDQVAADDLLVEIELAKDA